MSDKKEKFGFNATWSISEGGILSPAEVEIKKLKPGSGYNFYIRKLSENNPDYYIELNFSFIHLLITPAETGCLYYENHHCHRPLLFTRLPVTASRPGSNL